MKQCCNLKIQSPISGIVCRVEWSMSFNSAPMRDGASTPRVSARARYHAPDRVADIIGHQQRALLVDRDTDRPTAGIALRVEEIGEHIFEFAGWLAVRERYEHDLVAAGRIAIP